jgi:hypothetical protein
MRLWPEERMVPEASAPEPAVLSATRVLSSANWLVAASRPPPAEVALLKATVSLSRVTPTAAPPGPPAVL